MSLLPVAISHFVLGTACIAALAQPVCPPQPARWAEGFNAPGFFGGSLWTADVVDDDGPEGPREATLYIGGNFTEVGGRVTRSMVRWNPQLPDGVGGRGVWEPFPVQINTSGSIKKLISFDLDGAAGPNPTRLIALGQFSGPGFVNGVYFNGAAWQQLSFASMPFFEDAVAFDADASGPGEPELFVASSFGVLRWNGTTLATTMGTTGTNLSGDGFAIFDTDGAGAELPSLFFGHNSQLFRWNGTRFVGHSPAPPITSNIGAVITADPDGVGPFPESLIVITTSGQVRILQPGATSWTSLPTIGPAPNVSALSATTIDPDGFGPLTAGLVVSGNPSAGSGPIANFFNGAAWSNLGPSGLFFNNSRALAAFDFDGDGPRPVELFCGGTAINTVGGANLLNAGVWDTTLNPAAWRASIAGDGLSTGATVRGAVVDEDGAGPLPRRLVLAGIIGSAGPSAGRQIIRLDDPHEQLGLPIAWTFINPDTTPLNNPIGIASFDFDGAGPEGESLVIIHFWNLGLPTLTSPIPYVGRIAPPISAFATWDMRGQFTFSTTSPDGALGVFDEDGLGPNPAALYVAGPFTEVDGVPVVGLARWVVGASAWQAPPVPYAGESITAMTGFDDDGDGPNPPRLHVVARISASSWTVYRMDDGAWTRLGDPLSTAGIYAITGFDDDGAGPNPPRLYIGGDPFGSLSPPVRVRVWDGTTWQVAGGPLGGVIGGQGVRSLVEFDDDGPGPNAPALFASGGMTAINMTAIPGGMVKLVNGAWQPVATVSGAGGQSFVIDPDNAGPRPASLFYAGRVVAPSGVLSTNASLWTIPPVGADFNADWNVTLQDLFDFLEGYFSGDPRADIDGSGTIAVGDIFEFLRRYFGGC